VPGTSISQPFEDPALIENTADERYDLKLSSQLGDSHRVDVKIGNDETYHPWADDANVNAVSTWKYRTRDNQIVNGEYSGVLAASTVLQVRGGYWRGDNGDLPLNLADRDTIHHANFDVFPTYRSGGPLWDWVWEQHHDQADIVVSQYADDLLGSEHEFKFGVQYNQGGGSTTTYDTDYNYAFYGSLYKWAQNPYQYGGDTESLSAFVTDSWKVGDSLTLDLGVRYDRHDATIPDLNALDINSQSTGVTVPGKDMFSWKQFSPRLGFALQLGEDGLSVLRGSAGIYRDGTVSGNWYAPAPGAPPYIQS
jgi:outer membrane receptor protein involved in Fe transport